MEIHALLDDLTGKLISRWRPFAPGSIMLRIADLPRMERQKDPEHPLPPDDGRTRETAGAARPSPLTDIPPELLTLARTAAGLRILREGLTTRVEELVLREVWVEAQLRAMESGSSFAEGISSVLDEEREINSRLEE
jgi:hypothetical protein